ncbi:tyrosine-type recombinase/integrase [Sphingomonas sp. IC4-52]|uniref:tyrosine-type recombinase/integrase n=1 Tax=Sphingomonas sp. IC4-52 TaxID=2887202 RepID=UPI0022393F08|nr:integrase arm-type DNA-binding domain-containing protein [Sphingomonas sp. IC4-52]
MHLYVAPTGLKSFRWRFRFAGKEQLLTLGSYPELDLVAARARADAAREQLARGEDPRTRSARVETFEAAARAWHAVQLEGWTPVHAADVLVSLERDVFPTIGAQPLGAIAPADVLELLRAVERRGARETARRLRQRIPQQRATACCSCQSPGRIRQACPIPSQVGASSSGGAGWAGIGAEIGRRGSKVRAERGRTPRSGTVRSGR